MEKKLAVHGNSLALVIDRPLRELLGIRRDTLLRVTTDGRRLVVEPIDEDLPAPPSASELDAYPVYRTLVERFGMGREQFQRLHHAGAAMRMNAYAGWLEHGFSAEATPTELATIRRFETCLRDLRTGASWEAAIDRAHSSVPFEDG